MNNPKPFHRRIAIILLAIFIPSLFPVNMLYASNNGPNAPEAQGFEPVTATDMVNLSSGDMSYVLPVMDVNGFPVTLSYHGGVPMDLESSWVGLGWNLNTGAINRNLSATPDDWKGGNSVDFIRFEDSEDIYSINMGYGINSLAEVGVGMSWGSNKSLTGSVYGSFSMVNASIGTDGNYSVGLQAGFKSGGGTTYGGGITMSGNVNSGKKSFSVGAGVTTSSGLTIGMGTSLTGGGISASLGYSNAEGSGKTATGGGAGAGLSMNSFSQGDWDVTSKGWYIPIQVYAFSFGFGKQKVTHNLKKSYSKKGYGILNHNSLSNATDTNADNVYSDYQNRYVYGDAYDQTLTQSEKEFVGDYDLEREKLNFTFAGYDNYDVNATGISGAISPKIIDNATLYGMGYQGNNPKSTSQGKQRVYYHNGNVSRKTFGNGLSSDVKFYFDGQYTSNLSVAPLNPILNSATTGNNLTNNMSSRPSVNNSRLQQGNFVEVFTNEQIKNGLANGLLDPENLPKNQRTATNQFKSEGIGGYKITAVDGKVYHFSLPVYHFETVQRTILKDTTENHVNEKRQYTQYATHWLLTAITGPDYFDNNNNSIADEGDYGYWVRLKHGKWSDGYVWRTPTDKNLKDYTTNIEGNVGKKDFGLYEFGRKQLYYLDKIVSNTHTAYFVKDLRYDSVGSDLNYKYDTNDNTIPNSGFGSGYNYLFENFAYKKQMQLMLKKIVLVKNSDAQNFELNLNSSTNQLLLNTGGVQDYQNSYNIGFASGGGFANEYGINHNIKLNQEQNVIDVKDFDSFDFSKAIKVVDFGYNYNLAVKDHNYTVGSNLSNGSPGVIKNTAMNPNHGKLTLKSVKFLGRNNFDYMPPYQFEYDGEFINASLPYVEYPPNAIAQRTETSWTANYQEGYPQINSTTIETPMQNIRAKDEWGFRKERPEAWTMTKIKTPTGASIEFEHEEDDFYTEAFSRAFWMKDLKFKVTDLGSQLRIEIMNDVGLLQNTVDDFTKYFTLNDRVFMDLWMCREVRGRDGIGSIWTDRGSIDINGNNTCTVENVQQLKLTLLINKLTNTLGGNHQNRILNNYFSENANSAGSHVFDGKPRGICAEAPTPGWDTSDHWTISYKLLASKTPVDEVGGGLRVKSITLKDENNNKYKTSYYYNVPGSNKVKNVGDYKSSGITSYSPVKGTKFVPYQSELPSPGVMYEYVTMVAENLSGQSLGETRYRFYTLRPVLDIFNENIEMMYDNGEIMFKANVDNSYNTSNGYFNESKKLQAKKINLQVNTSLVGQFRTIEEFNTKGQLMSKNEKNYLSGPTLKALANLPSSNIDKVYRGTIQESFQSMKSVYNADSDNNNPVLQNRFLSISSKEEFPSVLSSIVSVTPNGKETELYKGSDPMTGTFNIVEKQKADGKWSKIERVPAYSKYAQMGSKVTSITNKHMLTQDAMSITSVKIGNVWKTTDANITTWNDTWAYRNETTGSDATESSKKVWRKHKTFAWKEALNADGAYSTTLTKDNTQFNWGLGTPVSDKWQKLSEITRYTRWSMPIETKDINGNFASTKMADNDTKVLVSGNARYTEMYFSGAEYVKSGNLFDGEVKGASFRSDDVAHTGKYSVKANNITDKVFEVNGSTGSSDYYNTTSYTSTFRPGKYKISVWALEEGNPVQNAKLTVNGAEIRVSESVKAGCWRQLNYYFDLPANYAINNIAITAKSINGKNYFDDFRMSPIASNINSYVYNEITDELSYSLDANNIGSAFLYDNSGRLIANYAEIIDTPVQQGGFKITSQFKQNYKTVNSGSLSINPVIDNCYTLPEPLDASIENNCSFIDDGFVYKRKYKINATGGSGNYSYEYKWLKNFNSNTYTNYFSCTSDVVIPYTVQNCPSSNEFKKVWKLVVKVTDLVTGESIIRDYTYTGSTCYDSNDYPLFHENIAMISKEYCSNECSPNYLAFNVHLINPTMVGNFKLEYAHSSSLDQNVINNLNWIDVTNVDGRFCLEPDIVMGNCIEFYQWLHVRATNLDTGEVYITTGLSFSVCNLDNFNPNDRPVSPENYLMEYGEAVFLFNSDGKIIEVHSAK